MRFFNDLIKKQPYRRYGDKQDRLRRLFGQILSLIAVALGIYYLFWHFHYINWSIWYISIPFFLAEVTGWLLFTFFAIISWYPRYHDLQGLTPERPFSVDVFVTICGEPRDIVEATLAAVQAIDYQPKEIYVLDDGTDPGVEPLARDFGFNYLARPEHRDAKAGNLNYGLAHSKGELILTLDADQVPQPEILQRLVGYFNISGIAFVQTKQNFRVPVGDPFGNSDKIFYNVMQPGKDDDNAAFSCGSGVIYRRQALEEIGGFSTWNLVEDLHTSMILHQRGWRSIYYNHPLTTGATPTDIWGVYRQRRQWAVDSLRIMFWDNPFFRRGLSLGQKLQYFHIGFVYLVSGWVMPIFFIVPIWTLFTNMPVLTATVPNYILNRLPYFIVMAVAYATLTFPTAYLHAFQMWSGLFPVFIQATFVALCHRRSKPAYRVTPKKMRQRLEKPAILAILPQLTIIVGAALAIIWGLFGNPGSVDFRMLNCAWATWAIMILIGICTAALAKVHWEEEITERPWFTLRQVIDNVLSIAIFLFAVILIAKMILDLQI
jgi:cellulose synthase (UDP-forming)